MLKHLVIFKYKPSASAAQIQQATDAFPDLKNKIPGILLCSAKLICAEGPALGQAQNAH
jgi:hypothetical protein